MTGNTETLVLFLEATLVVRYRIAIPIQYFDESYAVLKFKHSWNRLKGCKCM
jgi:hypothetical protein